MENRVVVFAYFTPDVTFPIASALAAVVGFVVLVGGAPLRYVAKAFRYLTAPFWWAAGRTPGRDRNKRREP
jgi:hypothetical protein